MSQLLPESFVFAGDSGPRVYFLDVEDKFARGACAVWDVAPGAPFPEEARWVAADVPGFVQWMVEGG